MSKDQVRQHLRNAPPGTDPGQIIEALRANGVQMEGDPVPMPQQQATEQGGGLFQKLAARNQAAFGSNTGLLESAMNPEQAFQSQSATGRFLTGQQGLDETALQIAGQGAGAVNDIIGEGLKWGGKALSAMTPDAIEKPVVGAVKDAGVAILQTPVGQAGMTALQQGMEAYDAWKKQNPRYAADLESAANIASLLPVPKLGELGSKAVGTVGGKVDDAALALSKPIKESAEASVSRVLNPTTKATKETTQKLAPELVKRPLSETLAVTRKGMQAKAGVAAEVAGEAIDQAGALTGKTKTSELVNFLESQKQAFTAGGKVVNEEGVKSVDNVIQILSQYGDEIDDETMRAVRRIFDTEVREGKKSFTMSAGEASKVEMKKRAANKIRGILAEKYPDVAKLNKEFTFWKNLEDVLEKTTARKTGQKQALKFVATVGGATTGTGPLSKIANAVGFNVVAGLIDSPAWGFVNAKIKGRLADALAQSDVGEIGKILSILPQQLAVQSQSDE